MFESEQLRLEFKNIVYTFFGADGGIKFIKLRILLESLEKQIDSDIVAKGIVEVMSKFSRLIDAAQRS